MAKPTTSSSASGNRTDGIDSRLEHLQPQRPKPTTTSTNLFPLHPRQRLRIARNDPDQVRQEHLALVRQLVEE